MATAISAIALTFLHSNTFFPSKNAPISFTSPLNFTKPPPLLSFSSSLSSSSSSSSSCCRIIRVSTAPLDYAPPAPESNFHHEITRLKALREMLNDCSSLHQKQLVLDSDPRVKRFFNSSNGAGIRGLDRLNLGCRELFLLKCMVAAGQEHVISVGVDLGTGEMETAWNSVKSALYTLAEMIERVDGREGNGLKKSNGGGGVWMNDEEVEDFGKLLKILEDVEGFYDCIGGIIGYQIMVLELLAQSTYEKQTANWSQNIQQSMECQFLEIHAPSTIDLSKDTDYASQAALWGIEGLPDLGEIYPLGGSADRLGLVDPVTGDCLPAAMLPYCGRTLLEGLIRDLQAREFLYFKLYGKQCITPVAIMTSSAKNNHERITSLCEKHNWFGRSQSSFQLFEQPLVPAVAAEDAQWLMTKPFTPVSKPGGHGVIWKLAYDKGIFEWFHDHGRKGAAVRQVSNVVAATDLTLLALTGIGLRHGKKMGFASCKRNSGATEGINVLVEKKTLDGKWAYGVSCIEYTEFDKFGIKSGPNSSKSLQAEFPANTNILYVDLMAVESIASSSSTKCLPGMVLNTKKPIVYKDDIGNCHSVPGGRLECTMQNIADNFLNTHISRCYQGVEDKLDTFIVYNERRKVTSSAKKKRHVNNSLHQTPDGALLDILRNAYDILFHCNIELPEIEGNDRYVDSGPPFLIFLHPALGPLWEVTRQKFSGGSISKGSELQVEVAEFLWRNVELDGSLNVIAANVMGSTKAYTNGEPILQYGHRCARCRLQNVKVVNEGINWSYGENVYWKHDVHRFEALKIVLHGNAEFEAYNVTIKGNHVFEVPDGFKMKITSGNSGLEIQLNPIAENMMDSGSWFWNYAVNGTHILLELVEL